MPRAFKKGVGLVNRSDRSLELGSGLNLTDVEALILIGSLVLGLIPLRQPLNLCKGSETDDLNRAFLHVFGDSVENSINGTLCGCFGGVLAQGLLYGFDELSFIHVCFLFVWKYGYVS